MTAHACTVCGSPNAPYGIGTPLKEAHAWYCAEHWQREPSTQAMYAARMAEMIGSADV